MPQSTKSTVFLFAILVATFIVAESCKKETTIVHLTGDPVAVPDSLWPNPYPPGTTPIPASPQRSGDPVAGYDYLITGDYLKSGLPYAEHVAAFGSDPSNDLNRTGDNVQINYRFTAVDAPNGVRVVAANCLQCHAQNLDGNLIIGLGNSFSDFTDDQSGGIGLLDAIVTANYGNPSLEWDAYEPFSTALKAVGPELMTECVGVNPADKLATVLSIHRNKNDLTWITNPTTPIPSEVVPTDVPAWWLLKKKNAMFYTASGRGDFTRFLMTSNLLTVSDTIEASDVYAHFDDVLSYIYSITPPAYPNSIDETKKQEGKVIYDQFCAQCHGTPTSYPNLLVDINTIGTDPLLVNTNYAYPEFSSWFNTGWFSKPPSPGFIVNDGGYIAPPLDGIWATAPYLHNASVPTLWDLLKSSDRPRYWSRSWSSSDIDYSKVGWNYTVETSGAGDDIYDTDLDGYGNMGHYFGDGLTDTERWALIEYLKSL